jgi:hypothetical protein
LECSVMDARGVSCRVRLIMDDNVRAKHKALFDEMLRYVDQTLKLLPPKQALSKKDAVLLRWVMTMGVMILNVGRSISRLIDTEDAVSIIILSRCLYEYRIKTRYFLKDANSRRTAFDQFRTTVSAYIDALKKLPTLTATVDAQLTRAQEAWIKAGGKDELFTGKIGPTSMAIALAEPADVLRDEDGNKYTYELRTFYNVPSWFVHGSPPLIAEFFERWLPEERDVADFNISTTPLYHNDINHMIRGVIADLYMYLGTVRTYYKIEVFSVRLAVDRAKALMPPEIRQRIEAMLKNQA